MADRMLQRRGTTAEWAAEDEVLGAGQIGWDKELGVIKFGDGVTPWSGLQAFDQDVAKYLHPVTDPSLVLPYGVLGLSFIGELKLGDGTTAWSALPLINIAKSDGEATRLTVRDSIRLAPLSDSTVHEGGQIDILSARKGDGTPWNAPHSIDVYQDVLRFLHPGGPQTTVSKDGLWNFNGLIVPSLVATPQVIDSQFLTTSSSWVEGPGPDISFAVPPSRKVLISIAAAMWNDSGGAALMSYNLWDEFAGSEYYAAGNNRANITASLTVETKTYTSIWVFPFSDIGKTLTAHSKYGVSGGGTGSFSYRRMSVVPLI